VRAVRLGDGHGRQGRLVGLEFHERAQDAIGVLGDEQIADGRGALIARVAGVVVPGIGSGVDLLVEFISGGARGVVSAAGGQGDEHRAADQKIKKTGRGLRYN
jgi:hypothetical protein